MMRVLIATDAWKPQINGVVRTLTSLAQSVAALGDNIEFLTPDGFPSMELPTYRGLRIAFPNRREIERRIEAAKPDAIHIATEGPMGWAVRAFCIRRAIRFTTSYTTKFPEYIAARTVIPVSWSYEVLRRFHAAAAMTMVSTQSLKDELKRRGFTKIGMWTRGVNTDLFHPEAPARLDLPRPIFMSMGRVAVEKNLEAFLSLPLPGSKVIIGDGPQRAELEARYPDAVFLGMKEGQELSSYLAAADVFVFPSLTDTYGVAQLEALACGTPVAAFPVTGPKDVIGGHSVGALDHDLEKACLRALTVKREDCRKFALEHSWENSARQFIQNVHEVKFNDPSRSVRRVSAVTRAYP